MAQTFPYDRCAYQRHANITAYYESSITKEYVDHADPLVYVESQRIYKIWGTIPHASKLLGIVSEAFLFHLAYKNRPPCVDATVYEYKNRKNDETDSREYQLHHVYRYHRQGIHREKRNCTHDLVYTVGRLWLSKCCTRSLLKDFRYQVETPCQFRACTARRGYFQA